MEAVGTKLKEARTATNKARRIARHKRRMAKHPLHNLRGATRAKRRRHLKAEYEAQQAVGTIICPPSPPLR